MIGVAVSAASSCEGGGVGVGVGDGEGDGLGVGVGAETGGGSFESWHELSINAMQETAAIIGILRIN
ncbi:hypothetical protein [Hephaestia mangrovi]|uniref:hypothetical protein n=1 Tax=Hephaestia mangrovi TaxID=2873268 RepID=UPI001CA688D0|nr:hypothetical protein [Hephaestia mangrovi]MBY8827013.1 hypothetical protein [Hephaestia mangrovi]